MLVPIRKRENENYNICHILFLHVPTLTLNCNLLGLDMKPKVIKCAYLPEQLGTQQLYRGMFSGQIIVVSSLRCGYYSIYTPRPSQFSIFCHLSSNIMSRCRCREAKKLSRAQLHYLVMSLAISLFK